MQSSRFRFFMGEPRSRWCNDGQGMRMGNLLIYSAATDSCIWMRATFPSSGTLILEGEESFDSPCRHRRDAEPRHPAAVIHPAAADGVEEAIVAVPQLVHVACSLCAFRSHTLPTRMRRLFTAVTCHRLGVARHGRRPAIGFASRYRWSAAAKALRSSRSVGSNSLHAMRPSTSLRRNWTLTHESPRRRRSR